MACYNNCMDSIRQHYLLVFFSPFSNFWHIRCGSFCIVREFVTNNKRNFYRTKCLPDILSTWISKSYRTDSAYARIISINQMSTEFHTHFCNIRRRNFGLAFHIEQIHRLLIIGRNAFYSRHIKCINLVRILVTYSKQGHQPPLRTTEQRKYTSVLTCEWKRLMSTQTFLAFIGQYLRDSA